MDTYEHLTRKQLISRIRDLETKQKCAGGARSRVHPKFFVFGEGEQREFERSLHPIRIFDRETTKYLAVNDAAVKLYGYTREEFLKLTPTDTRHPEERAEFVTTLREPTGYLRHRGARRHVTKSGAIIVVEIVTQDILFHGREARLSLTIDVTERVRMQETIRRREQEFAALVENAPDIVARFDRDLRYVYVNPAMCAATGTAREAFIGKTSGELAIPVYLGSLWEEGIRRVFDSGDECRIEFDCPCHGGIRYFEARAVPEFGSGGAVETVLTISRDITERRRAEQALRASEEFLRRMVESSRDCIKVLDLEGRLLSMNGGGQRLMEIDDVTPLLNRSWLGFWQGAGNAAARDAVAAASKGKTGQFEGYCATAKGAPKWWDVLVTPMCGADGKPEKLLAVSRDITRRKQAEDEARRQEKLFEAVFDNLPLGVFIKDAQTLGYVRSNRFARKTFGYPLESSAGKTVYDLFPKEQADRFDQTDKEALETGRMVEIPAQEALGNAGDVRIQHVRKVPVFDAEGRPWVVVGIADDITERKRAEDDMKRSRERLQLALEGARLALWDANAESGEVFLSERWAEMLGEPRRETRTTVKDLLQLVHPEDRQRVLDAAVLVLKGARPDYAEEHRVRAVTGEWRWVLSRGRVTERAANGRAARMSGTNLDITDRKRAEETRALLAAIVESSNDAIITRRPDRTILSWNAGAERIFGWSAAEAIGQPIDLIVPPERRGALQPTVNRVLRGELVEPVETTNLRKDGVRIHTQVTLSAIRDERGKEIAFASTTRDITQRKHAEELLKRRKEEFESLAENLPDLIVRFDRGIRRTYVNAALERATGLPREAFLGKTHREVPLPAEVAAQFDEGVREVFETGMSRQVEFSFVTGDGERFLESRQIPERDARGEVVSVLCVARDVTQRKLAEDELRRQKNLLGAIIEHLPVGVTVKDACTLRYVMRNRVAAELTGLSIAEGLGKRAHEVYPRELAEIIDDADRKALAGAAPKSFPSLVVQRHAGRIARNLKVPVPDETGRYTHLVSIVEDLTDIEQAQAALRRSEERLRQLISMSPAAIFSLSLEPPFATNFIGENVTAQVGWQPSDFTENPSFWLDHVHPDDRAPVSEELARIATEGKYACEYRFRHKNGSWRWMHDEGRVVRDTDGTPREAIGIWMDITEQRRENEERLERALRQRNALVREVHHRIKNHLQGIAGLLRQKALMHPAVASLLEGAVAQMQSVALVFGLQEDAESPVRLSQVLESICASVEDLSAARINRQWDTRGAVSLQLAANEAVPVAVAINELMFNAVKHCGGGERIPAIDVSFLEHGAKAEIRIANHGSLPHGFDYAAGAGCGTGLELVKTLLGPRGSELSFRARNGWVETVLALTEPLVSTAYAAEAVA